MAYPSDPLNLANPADRTEADGATLRQKLSAIITSYKNAIEAAQTWAQGVVTALAAKADAAGVTSALAGKADLTGGKVPTSQLGTGTANASVVLYGNQTWAAPPSGGGSGMVIQDENSTAFAARATLRLTGAGVTAVDNPGANRVDVTIPGGSGGGSTAPYLLRLDDYGADPSGATFSDAAMAACINDAFEYTSGPLVYRTTGATILLGGGTYKFANPIDFANIQGVTVQGYGALTNGGGTGNFVTQLLYTGYTNQTGDLGDRFIDGRSATGLVLKNLQVAFDNPAFCGTLVDFGSYLRVSQTLNFTQGSSTVTAPAGFFLPRDQVIPGTQAGRVFSVYPKNNDPGLPFFPGNTGVKNVSPDGSSATLADMVDGSTRTALQTGVTSGAFLTPDSACCWVIDCNLTGKDTRGGNNGGVLGTGGPQNSHKSSEISRLLGFRGGTMGGALRTSFKQASRAIDGVYTGDTNSGGYNGAAGNPYEGFSNAITIRQCHFAVTNQAFIWNAAQAWTIDANTFEAHSNIPNNPAYDEGPANGSIGVSFTNNWCGDGQPEYWIWIKAGRGWSITGNYFARFQDDISTAGACLNLEGCSGINISGNYIRGGYRTGASPPSAPPYAPPFDGFAGVAPSEGITYVGNTTGALGANPVRYVGLANVFMAGNYWGAAGQVQPGNGYYVTDASGTRRDGGP